MIASLARHKSTLAMVIDAVVETEHLGGAGRGEFQRLALGMPAGLLVRAVGDGWAWREDGGVRRQEEAHRSGADRYSVNRLARIRLRPL